VTKDGKYKVRWVDDDVYLNVIRQMRNLYDNPTFHIFSDGYPKHLAIFAQNDVIIHPRKNVLDTFHHMVCADILMPGQSMFSTLAGYLCNGIKIARPWSPHWSNFPKTNEFVEVNMLGNFLPGLSKGK
jgi:hypothetical protein